MHYKKRGYSLGFSRVSKKHGYRSAIAAFFANAAKKNAVIAHVFCSDSTPWYLDKKDHILYPILPQALVRSPFFHQVRVANYGPKY